MGCSNKGFDSLLEAFVRMHHLAVHQDLILVALQLPRKQRSLLLRRVSQAPRGAKVDGHRPRSRRQEVIQQAASPVAPLRPGAPQPLRALRDLPIKHRQHLPRRPKTPQAQLRIFRARSRHPPVIDRFKEPICRNYPRCSHQ